MDNFIKRAKIVKRKNKWSVISHHRDQEGKYKNFGCYDTKEEAKKRLGQIHGFKSKGAIDVLINTANKLDQKGKFDLSDKISSCLEDLLNNTSGQLKISGQFAYIMEELKKNGELKLNYQIDSIIPDIVAFESGTLSEMSEPPKEKESLERRVYAEKAYFMANNIYNKYLTGLYDANDFEMSMYARLKSMLKMGFLLDSKTINKESVSGCNNWWEYFKQGVKK